MHIFILKNSGRCEENSHCRGFALVRNERCDVGFEHVIDLDDIGRQLSTGFASLDLLNERNDFRPNQCEHCVHLRDQFQQRCVTTTTGLKQNIVNQLIFCVRAWIVDFLFE